MTCLPRCLCALVFALICLSPASGWANQIKMTSGKVYAGVNILGRDGGSIEISGPQGRKKLLLTDIAEIDGIQLLPAPAATAAPVVTATPAPPKVVNSPSPAPLVPPTPTPAGVPYIPTAANPEPTAASADPGLTGGSADTTASDHFEWAAPWIPWALAAFPILWVASVVLVWLDLSRRRIKSRHWIYASALLPIAGALAYLALGRRGEGGEPPFPTEGLPPRAPIDFQFVDENNDLIMLKPGVEVSGIQLAKDILNDALIDRASDVHIEPASGEYGVRFRVDGLLYPRMKFASDEGLRLVSSIKSLAQMDITERRKAQDGRFGGRSGPREVDFRVATTPTVFGEKLVVRILDSKSGLRGLKDLGMTEAMLAEFSQVIHSRNGMILATGPTGSGKTSTLYAALSQLDAVGLNLVTIEDPVEYQLAGATQIPVNIKAGVTYESGLRSVLRQDPDVILVGEMRDKEAAVIALRSALTGHLVFSSLHTQNAIGTIMRLEEMGIERHLLASALSVLIAQRLVRILCTVCREAYPCAGDELAELGLELPPGSEIYRSKGCRRCDMTGYLGRTGVFEMLVFDDSLRQAVNDGAGEAELYEAAHKKGFRGYREDAAMKILLGITTVDEVLKAV